jgi:hypothetical protein
MHAGISISNISSINDGNFSLFIGVLHDAPVNADFEFKIITYDELTSCSWPDLMGGQR